jgi:CsoR family transcriptional regulator, copper-sensing transcriptional repressor
MALASDELKAELTTRLRRIEGQVRGVQRMVEEDRDCPDVLQQMTAIRAALHNASLLLARSYVACCLKETGQSEAEETLDKLMTVLAKVE